MFATKSMTGTGLAIIAVEYLLTAMNISFEAGSVAAFVNGIVTVVGFVWIVWGQLRRKDLSWGMFRN